MESQLPNSIFCINLMLQEKKSELKIVEELYTLFKLEKINLLVLIEFGLLVKIVGVQVYLSQELSETKQQGSMV